MVIWILSSMSACWWVWQGVLIVRAMRNVHLLPAGEWRHADVGVPLVAVVSPARNEEDAIADAVRCKLSDPCSWIQFLFVNDRSTDTTGSILDRVTADDPRACVLHNETLPEGWLGKVYAQQLGVEAAAISKEGWYLFSDGDTHIRAGAVSAAVAWAESLGADHVSMTPRIVKGPAILRLCLPSLLRGLLVMLKLWKANDDRSPAAFGVGAFNLVRRSALERAGGLEQLKLEVADDVGIGQIIKDSGGRSRVALGSEWVHIEWYRTARQFLAGSEKGVAKARSRGRLLLVGCVAIAVTALDIGPFILAGWFPHPAAWLALATAAFAVFLSVVLASWFALSARWALLSPIGSVVCLLVVGRSIVLACVRGGVRWRGDTHSLQSTAAGERVRF